jgi:hypothetical protein
MNKSINLITIAVLLFFTSSFLSAQSVKIGPRLTGNFNIFNLDGLTGSYNGVGIGIGGAVDVSFSNTLGILTNLTVFDMKSFSNSTTQGTQTTELSFSLSYLTLDPLFKAEFSGFYMVAGPSIGIKLSSSGEQTTTNTGQVPVVQPNNKTTNSLKFDIAFGVGYNFKLSNDLYLGSDFMAYIPLTDTYDFPGQNNSLLSLKLGASLKFKI